MINFFIKGYFKRGCIPIISLLTAASLSIFPACSKPTPSDVALGEIAASGEPEQIQARDRGPIVIDVKGGRFSLTPVAGYSMSAVVVGKEFYSDRWRSELAPIDLALVWGRLIEPEIEKYVKFSQSDRWYYFEYEDGFPLDASYILIHSSNNHIIPANRNILLAVKSIKRGEKITLTGFLVNAKGRYNDMDFWWNSSLTRNDSEDGSCELFYITAVRRREHVYKFRYLIESGKADIFIK